MGLAEVQAALARLYTDAAWREAFLAAPETTGGALGLDPAEARALAAQPAPRLRFVADSLRRKRLNEVVKLLPSAHRALGPRFAALFWQFADGYLPRGPHRHRADARAFAAFVAQTARAAPLDPPWAADLLAYEAAWLEAADPACRVLVRRFALDPRPLAHALAQGLPPPTPPRRPTLALWLRPLPHRAAWHQIIPLPSMS
jgi:hypothetical protein